MIINICKENQLRLTVRILKKCLGIILQKHLGTLYSLIKTYATYLIDKNVKNKR